MGAPALSNSLNQLYIYLIDDPLRNSIVVGVLLERGNCNSGVPGSNPV